MKKLSGMLLAVLLMGVNVSYAEGSSASSDASFLKSYKDSFLKSCVESSGGSQYEGICKCVLDDVVKNFSVAEIKNEKKVSEYIQSVAMGKCEK